MGFNNAKPPGHLNLSPFFLNISTEKRYSRHDRRQECIKKQGNFPKMSQSIAKAWINVRKGAIYTKSTTIYPLLK